MGMDKSNNTRQFQFGPFSLGGEPDCLRRGADPIPLRPMSLQVLRYLSERPGRFVSKDELLERVWTGRVISDSGLRICVGEIRSALGDDAKNPQYLETIVGKGYRFLEGAGGKAPYADSTGPIVGRDAELSRLGDIYQSVDAGHTQFVLLAGEPGIGKTTLVNSFLERIPRDHDVHVIQGQCVVHCGKQEAYGPVLEAIAEFYRDHSDTGLIREMERHAPGWLLQFPEMLDAMLFERVRRRTEGMAPERMTREFCQLVATLGEKKPLVIVIEDLHWADVSTIDLLAALAKHANLPLMILGTYRPADAVLYNQSLRDTVRELKGRGLCRELLLELLTATDLTKYLAGRLNGESSVDFIDGLYRRTGGNPLFMVKLLEELIKTQALVCHDGLWCVGDPAGVLEADIPDSLQSLIRRHLEALSPAHREILEVASVVGMEFSAAAMTDALAKPIEEIESECDKLSTDCQFIEPGNLLTWPDDTLTGCYRFHHHLYLEVINRQIAEARRARIHRKVGERLEVDYGERAPEIAPILASHFEFGNDPERSLRYCWLSAEQALGRHAYSTAIGDLGSALEKLEQMPQTTERDQQRLDKLSTDCQFIEPGNLLTWPDDTLTGCYRFHHHLYLEVINRQIAEARRARIHRKVGERLEVDYGERAPEIAPILASHFEFGNDPERSLRYRWLSAEQALGRHAYSTAIGELGAALDKLEQMPQTTERDQQLLDCLNLLGSTLIAVQGYFSPEVEKAVSRALEICDTVPGSEMKFNALWNLAGFHMSRGELARSQSLIEQAAELAKELDNPDLGLLADDMLAQQFIATGDFKNASEHSARGLAQYDSSRHGKLAQAYGQEDPAQSCAGIDVIASWVLGFSDRSQARERLVHELSAELNNPHSTALGLLYCAIASQFRQDPLATQKYADELFELTNHHELHWMPIAMALKGWATAKQAPGVENLEMIENALTSYRQAEAGVFIPYCLGLLAETQRELGQLREAQASVAEALSLVAQTGVGWYEIQLYRLQGELFLQLGADRREAERSFMKSLEIARNRSALMLELHAAVSLSRLWIEQGRTLEVPELLKPIVARFNENSDDSDLNQARKLIVVNC